MQANDNQEDTLQHQQDLAVRVHFNKSSTQMMFPSYHMDIIAGNSSAVPTDVKKLSNQLP